MTERDIVAAANDRTDPDVRAAFLDDACAGDADLRTRVEHLLQGTPDSSFDAPTEHTPYAGEGVTRTLAPGDPAYAVTRAPDEGDSDVDLSALLAPPQEAGSVGRLGHYEVLGVVGRGGMGVVLKAHDTKLRRIVAVKLLAPALAAVGTARRRFAREAQSAAAVRDEHVVDIHAVCEDAAVPYLVMEFVSGITLEDRVRSGGPVPVREILRIGLQSARGLAAAHAQGLVHRDVKPGNILLEDGAGRVKLTDFGLARAADDASISRSGVIAGTPMYMSPEQAKGEQIDPRSDLFSLGSVLYTLCTGRPAFRAESTVAVLRRVCKESPRPIRAVNPGVPKWVCAVVEKLLAKDPADRVQTAAEVADLLAGYLAHLEAPGRVPPPPAVRGVRVRGRRRGRPVAALVAAATLVVLGVVGYRAFRPADETPVDPTAVTNPDQPTGDKPAAAWRPPTVEELAAWPSPLDGRTREQIPAGMLAQAGGLARVPPEIVAILGDARFRLPHRPQGGSHAEMRQDRAGKWLAVPHGDSVALFDARTGELVRTLTARTDLVHTVAISPDGRYLAGAIRSDAKTPYAIKIWDLETGQEVTSLQGAPGVSWAITFAPDGKQLFCLGQKGLDVWDVSAEKIIRSFPAAPAAVQHHFYSFGLSPDGKMLAWGDDSPKVKVWKVGSDDPPLTLDGHTARITYAAFSPDGRRLATGSDKELVVWDAEKLELVKKIDTQARWLAFEPGGKTILTATCSEAKSAGGHLVNRWDLSTFQSQPLPPLRPKVGHVQLSPDGKTLFFLVGDGLDRDRRVLPHDAATGKPLAPPSHTGEVWAVAVSPDGQSIASGGADGAVRLWDLAGWKAGDPQPPARVLTGHTATVYSVAFSPDAGLVASASLDGTIRLWDAATGETVRNLARDTKTPFSDVAFSADGKTLANGEADGSVRLWDVATGEKQSPLRWHTQHVNSVAVSPDNRFLASAGFNDRKVHVTDLRTFRRVQTLGPAGDGKAEMRVAFGGDGRTLAYGGWDNSVRLWDLVEKKETVLTGGGPSLDGLAVDPTGRFVAAARGGAVRFWDRTVPTRPVVIGPGPFGGMARHVAFTPEGRYLVVAGFNGTVSVVRTPRAQAPVSPEAARLSSAEAVKNLRGAVAAGPASLANLADAGFARVPLTKADAAVAREILWNAQVVIVRKERADEVKNRLLKDDKLEMPFSYKTFGQKPKDGWSLYISLHGGGNAAKQVNDQQWENQKKLYTLDEGLYLTPRAPTNTWNMWHEGHIDRLFDRLIEDLVAIEGVNPNRVYLMGYGAGGDGVYHLAPRLADRWAAAAMMGGHPNKVSLLSLRNVPFALQVGANDTAWDRNKLAKEYGETLDRLRKEDPKGYEQLVTLHEGKAAWMGGADKVALPWMAGFTRNPVPERVVWKQIGVLPGKASEQFTVLSPHHDRSYWLAVRPGEARLNSLVVANRDGQTVEITAADQVARLMVRFDDRMVDLDKPVTVRHAGKDLYVGEVPRTVDVMIRTLVGRGDPALMFDGEVEVELAGLDSTDLSAHVNLGLALLEKSHSEEAIARFRRAIDLDPNHAFAHGRLAVGLMNLGQWDEAEISIRKAIELDPKLASAHNNLGVVLNRKDRVEEAIACWRKAIELDPKLAQAHLNLGQAFLKKNQWDEAAATYLKVIELDPKLATAHAYLGYTLLAKSQFDEALASLRKALELDPNLTSAQVGLARAQHLVAARDNLPAFLKGEFKPSTNDERIALFDLCWGKKLYRAGAGLIADIFAADPKLADDLTTARRYNAACFAALAAAGQGEDAADLDTTERARLRKLALDWLRADLVLRTKQLNTDRATALGVLRHWQQDNQLANIRDAAALAKLPAEEGAAFTKLWAELAELLKKPEGTGPLTESEIRRIAALPAEAQVEEVRKELKRRNPNFDGTLAPTIQAGAVTGLEFITDGVTDIAPLRALTRLRTLKVQGSVPDKGALVDLTPLKGLSLTELTTNNNKVVDLTPLQGMPLQQLSLWLWRGSELTPLKGMPLKWLNCGGGRQKLDLTPLQALPLDFLCLNYTQVSDLTPLKNVPLTTLLCANTPVSDLTPLRGTKIKMLAIYKTNVTDLSPLKAMPLADLECDDARITDLSPLKDLPLKKIRCSFQPGRDTATLRAIKTLETINDKPAGEFWKSVDKK